MTGARELLRQRERPPLHRLEPTSSSASHGLHDSVLELQRLAGNRAVAGLAGGGLRVGAADSHTERVAAHHARELSGVSRRSSAETADPPPPASASAEDVEVGPGGGPLPPTLAAELSSARGSGGALPPQVHDAYASRLGGSVEGVRIHTDPRAASLATALGARALTSGRDVFFGPGQYAPGSPVGDRILAHELAHAVHHDDGVIHRVVGYDITKLKALQSTKSSLSKGRLSKLITQYDDYLNVAQKKPNAKVEQKLLNEMKQQAADWKTQRTKKASKKQTQKAAVIDAFVTAIDNELVALQPRVNEQVVREFGFPPALVTSWAMSGKIDAIVDVDRQLGLGNVAAADQALTRAALGAPTPLVKSTLMRRHIGRLNLPLTKAVVDPTFELDEHADRATIDAGAQQAQGYANKRLADITQLDQAYPKVPRPMPGLPGYTDRVQPADKTPAQWADIKKKLDEGATQAPTLGDLKGAAKYIKEGHDVRGFGAHKDMVAKGLASAPLTKEQEKDKASRAKAMGNLSAEEISAVLGYSTNLYKNFNDPLRSGVQQLGTGEVAVTLLAVSALNKLPAWDKKVYRHSGNFPGYEDVNQKGGTVTDPSFLSTARQQAGCNTGAEKHEVLEVITSKTGRDISPLAAFGPGEEEVLFRPYTQFSVTKTDKRADSTKSFTDPLANEYLANETANKDKILMVVFKEEA